MQPDTDTDWSERPGLEAGSHHWLPAYGFQQPADLQEALLQQGRTMDLFVDGDGQQAFLFLETILEETSDDLRSDSSCSGPAGWPDSDSDTASVIHITDTGSERELAVPCKRRRHNTDPGPGGHHDDEDTSSSRSSLAQFETLERHCEDVFRTSATAEPFPPSPSQQSNTFSFDSLETSRWRFCDSRDSLDDSLSDCSSSDGDTVNRSFSSRSANGSFRSSSGIRSCRSFDSLVLGQTSEKSDSSFLGGELSQSLNNTSLTADSPEPPPAPRGIYKTVECLTDVTPHVACSRTSSTTSQSKIDTEKRKESEGKDSTDGNKPERSAENLSEDSGFGEHMSSCNLRGRAEDEGDQPASARRGWDAASDARAKYNQVNWRSAPDLAASPQCERRTSVPNLYYNFTGSKSLVINYVQRQDDEEVADIPETKSFTQVTAEHKKMSSRFSSVASTPNLYSATEEFLIGERKGQYAESTSSLSRGKYSSVSRLSTATGSSRGSNIQITTSFVNLSHGGSTKGVHFCPVVSEVSWQESSSDEEDESDEDRREEEEEEASYDRTGSESSTPPFDTLVECLRASPVRRQPPVREDSVERRRVIEELHKLKLEKEKAPPRRHVGPGAAPRSQSLPVPIEQPAMEDRVKKKHGLGGFFQRFSFRRLSGRDKNKKEKKKKTLVNSSTTTQNQLKVRDRDEEDFKIIPLHPPGASAEPPSRPPPVPTAAPQPPPARRPQPSPAMATATAVRGLLETDLDSDIAAPANKKTRSLLNLDDGRNALKPCPVQREDSRESDSRAKSMEFLLDKENQAAVKPPENELQKVGGERVMSEHQLRVQRSLQKLNVPDWYLKSTLPAQGFLLKRNSDAGLASGWQGLNNKTTSLSSLGSTQSAAAPTTTPYNNSHALSPSPTSQVFSRWSTSRLSSGATSTSTSPCGSTRSSFNYRQPYLGWRSQERLSRPRTPAERLAADLLAHKKQESGAAAASAVGAPNLNEVRSSIKEVTSAIVHYVSGTKDSTDRLTPRWDRDTSSSRSASPRGSTGRLCWLESSFVGSRPLDVPATPATTAGPDLYLDLTPTPTPTHAAAHANGPGPRETGRPSPSSTTMEDVLDSLLGLPPASRSPSPSSPSLPIPAHPKQRRSCGDLHQESVSSGGEGAPNEVREMGRRRSEGCDPKIVPAPRNRRVSFEVEGNGLVRCRYSKCGKTSNVADARRTFKTCHNCAHVYCSRECRRAHWEKHRKTCLHSRVGALCRRVLSTVKEDSETLHHVSLLARRGFLARGRGAVKSFFSSPELAEKFVTNGLSEMGEPTYIRWADLLPNEMGPELYKELLRLCKSYNPDTRLVLYVAVCVVSEVPTSGAVKWERQLVSRCAKLRLSKPLIPQKQPTANITRDSEDPETLILTSLPGVGQGSQRARQISFTNVQRHLRQRGVSLRKQFPEVYQRLCAYVEGSAERFTPVTIYPRDSATGKSFMCIIMPDAEPEKLQLLPTDSTRVQTIDISQETQFS